MENEKQKLAFIGKQIIYLLLATSDVSIHVDSLIELLAF